MAAPAVHSEELAAESLGVERETGGRRNLVFHKGCWFFVFFSFIVGI